MSGKTEKANRRITGKHTFPASPPDEMIVKHSRRIIRLAKSDQITIQEAIDRYTKKAGLKLKPMASDLENFFNDVKLKS